MNYSTPNKKSIRTRWNLPLIKQIATTNNIKFHYFGLPGVDADDIVDWRDFIGSVTAFEAPDDSRTGRGSTNLANLEKRLIHLGFLPKCYCGLLEKVIDTGFDNRGVAFEPDIFYTIFNLDFTKHLTSPARLDDQRIISRFESFNKLVTLQKSAWKHTISGTLWLITLREEMHVDHYSAWLRCIDDKNITDVLHSYDVHDIISPRNSQLFFNPRKLRIFLYKILIDSFNAHNLSSYWFPTILYTGRTCNTRMAHFMLLTYMNTRDKFAPKLLQRRHEFLNLPIIDVHGTDFYQQSTLTNPEPFLTHPLIPFTVPLR